MGQSVEHIPADQTFQDTGLFAVGVRAGELTFLSADARTTEGEIGSAGDAATEARTALERLRLGLAATGQELRQIVALTIYLQDYQALEPVAAVIDESFPEPEGAFPATAFIGVSGLEGYAVRLDAIASAHPDRRQLLVPGIPLAAGSRCHGVRAGDLYFLSGIDAGDKPPSTDSLAATAAHQTTVGLERMGAILEYDGRSLGDVFRMFTYLRLMDDAAVQAAQRDARSRAFAGVFAPERVPAHTRVGARELGPNVLLRTVAHATRHPERAPVASPKVRPTPGVFSQAYRVGPWIWVSGQIALDREFRPIGEGDLGQQTTAALTAVKDIVEAGGGTLSDVVKTTVYLAAGQDRARFADAYQRFFDQHTGGRWLPAGLTVEVPDLAPPCLVEIDAVAYLGAAG